jgi:hypothetical protein
MEPVQANYSLIREGGYGNKIPVEYQPYWGD